MKRKIFIDTDLSEVEIIKITDKDIIERIKKVYKLKPQDSIIFVGKDLTEGIFIFKDSKNFIFQKIKSYQRKVFPKRLVNLYISFIKKENFELALRKCSELGVYKITPVICERSPWRSEKISERWIKITKTALEVSEWGFLPILENPIFLKDLPKNIFVLDKNGEVFDEKLFKNETNVLIGPEGGFSEKELKLLEEKEAIFISLGRVTLRSETAAFVILSLLNFPCW